jgi:hypothetical protein
MAGMESRLKTDRVMLSILGHYFRSAAEAASYALDTRKSQEIVSVIESVLAEMTR